jgi:Na+/phosphate symporter
VTRHLRTLGWLLIGMGVVFGGVTTLSLLGAFPLTIEVFDRSITSTRERWILVACWGVAVVVGGILVMVTRSSARSDRTTS